MAAPNDVIHQQVRLRIMATLNALEAGETMEFTRLRTILQATDGNLGTHLGTLEGAGYVEIAKEFADRKPRSLIRLTRAGKTAFEDHVRYLREILEGPPAT